MTNPLPRRSRKYSLSVATLCFFILSLSINPSRAGEKGPFAPRALLPGQVEHVFKGPVLNPTPSPTATSTFTFPAITVGAVISPYPATVNVSGLPDNIIKVRPKVRVSHAFLSDVGLLLVSPTGQAVEFFGRHPTTSDARVATDETYIFDQDALYNGSGAYGGIYKPNQSISDVTFGGSAPSGPYSRDLNAFNGANPNGQWKVYANDSAPFIDNGTIHAIELEIETASCSVSIPTVGTASSYPYPMVISGIPGGFSLSNLRVTIENFNHPFPDDVQMLLVGSGGQKCLLMANCGGSGDLENFDLTFQDGAPALPDGSSIPLQGTKTFRPTSYGSVDTFPAPAPAGPYGTVMNSTFEAGSPNGTWNLYVYDGREVYGGCFESASLSIVTSGMANLFPLDSFAGSTGITPPGSAIGWSNFGSSTATFDGAVASFPIPTHPTQTRTSALIRNKDGWFPVVEGYQFVGVFQIRALDQPNFNDWNQIPNLRARLQQRFAVNSMLEVFHHTGDSAAQYLLEQELRPTNNPSAASSAYFVPLRPISTARATASGEGVQIAFEAYANTPQEQGRLVATNMQIALEYEETQNLDVVPIKQYKTSASNAGQLAVFNPDAELQNVQYNFGVNPGDPPILVPGNGGTYSDSNLGVTLSTVGQPSTPRARIVSRNFNPANGGTDYANRVRIEDNKMYHARFHVSSTQRNIRQSQLRFRARSVKFSNSQKLEIGGVYAAGAISNGIAKQILPGPGVLNQDQRVVGEFGGWYTLSMYSPLHPYLRRGFPDGTPIATRMPNISGQPGPGVNAASRRDIFVGADVLDTLSTATGYELEEAQMTIDQIDLFSFTRAY